MASLAAAAWLCATAPALAARVSGRLVPATGTLMGAFVNPANSNTLSTLDHENLVLDFEAMIGRKLDVEMWYYRWGTDFWNGAPKWDLANGRTPLVKWGAGTPPSLDSIINGSQDAAIRAAADGVKALGKEFFFCPFWEMNGSWEPWSGANNNDPGTYDGPLKYIKAWRHIHDVFVQRGATNAVWVWAPDRGDSPKENWNHWLKYYPGDSYVDWVGVDGYNWGTAGSSWGSSWASFEDTLRPVYDDFDGRKPMMIAETASTELGGDKAQWMADAQAAIKARWPNLSALTWFNDNKETDWRVNSSTAALNAYKGWTRDPYFNLRAGGTAPSSAALPSVGGSPQQGSTLTAAAGTWLNAPTTFSSEWKRCNNDGGRCVSTGARGSTYTLTSSDVGYRMRFFSTATNAGGSATVASDPTPIVAPSTLSAPKWVTPTFVIGTFEQGNVLRVANGLWSGAPSSYSYQWRRCDSAGSNCVNIAGATGTAYTLTSSDVGGKVKVVVTARNSVGAGTYTATSRLIYGPAPASTTAPSVSGTAQRGMVLTGAKGSWSGSPTSYLYRWRRCDGGGNTCIDIAGATSSTYTVTSADAGSRLRFEVIASNGWGSAFVDSAATATVP